MQRARRITALIAAVAVVCLGASACGRAEAAPRRLPTWLVPDAIGGLKIAREPKAEAVWKHLPHNALITAGHVYTIRNGPSIEGDLQLAVFKSDTDTSDLTDAQDKHCTKKPKSCEGHRALAGMQAELGKGLGFQRLYYRGQRLYFTLQSDQRVYIWFPPATHAYVLMVFRRAFPRTSSDAFVHALLDHQAGVASSRVPLPTPGVSPPPDDDPLFSDPSPSPSPSEESP